MCFFIRRGMPQKAAAKPGSKTVDTWNIRMYGTVDSAKVPTDDTPWKKFFEFFVMYGIYQVIMVPFKTDSWAFVFRTTITKEKYDLAKIEHSTLGKSVEQAMGDECQKLLSDEFGFVRMADAVVKSHVDEIDKKIDLTKEKAYHAMNSDSNFKIQRACTFKLDGCYVFHNPCGLEKINARVTTMYIFDKTMMRDTPSRASTAEAQAGGSTTVEVSFKIPDPSQIDFQIQTEPGEPPCIHKDFDCSLSRSVESLNKLIAEAKANKDTKLESELTRKLEITKQLALTNREYSNKIASESHKLHNQFAREFGQHLASMSKSQANAVENMCEAMRVSKQKGSSDYNFLSDGVIDVLGRNMLQVQSQCEVLTNHFAKQMDHERKQSARTAERRQELETLDTIMRNLAQSNSAGSSYLRNVNAKSLSTTPDELLASVRHVAEGLQTIINAADWQRIANLPENEQLDAIRSKRPKTDDDSKKTETDPK